ncbi:hypothetical protein ABT154_12665 [Streptomyces sp. NPDC001728]|uniref:hypothetical protein n=1 Tax=Streptomyces sp. NPDC001728 TaxID=3154396 RepID=UPI0033304F45
MRSCQVDADRILAHVSLVTATTLAAVSAVTAGANTTYDNRLALDTWTIDRVIRLAGGGAGLRERVQVQADALCAHAGATLSKTELDTPVPTPLLSTTRPPSTGSYRSGTCSPASPKESCRATPGSSWRWYRGPAPGANPRTLTPPVPRTGTRANPLTLIPSVPRPGFAALSRRGRGGGGSGRVPPRAAPPG